MDTRRELDDVVSSLQKAGFSGIKALHGDDGIQLLERVDSFFFSDLEERVLERHIQELKEGHFIVAVDTPADQAEEVVNVASKHGARRLVRFGLLTVTWLK